MKAVKVKVVKGKVLSALLLALLLCGAAWGDVAYTTVAADYSSGTMGVLSGDAGAMVAEPSMVANLDSDLLLYSFTGGGLSRVLLDEHNTTAGDRISVYDPGDWSAPIANRSWSTTANAHGFEVVDGRLYVAAYDNANIVSYATHEGVASPYGPTGHYYTCRADSTSFQPHAERIVAVGSDLYALVNHADASYPPLYMASDLVKLNLDLDTSTSTRYELVGVQNASDMIALSDGSLAIAYRGGPQRAGTRGGIILVNLQDLEGEPTEIAGGEAADVGAVESLCSDGSGGLWFVAQVYQADSEGKWMDPISKLYHWTGSGAPQEVRNLSATSGYSYQVKRDEADGTLAVVAGDRILILDSAGTLQQEFDSVALGGNPTSVAFFRPVSGGSGDSGGSGGGCSAAGFGALALLLPLFLIRRKSR